MIICQTHSKIAWRCCGLIVINIFFSTLYKVSYKVKHLIFNLGKQKYQM